MKVGDPVEVHIVPDGWEVAPQVVRIVRRVKAVVRVLRVVRVVVPVVVRTARDVMVEGQEEAQNALVIVAKLAASQSQ